MKGFFVLNKMNLLTEFNRIIRLKKLVHNHDKILIAVSGGVDSVVLLHLFINICAELNLELQILHLNHCLREDESERDQQFVEHLGRQYNIPVIIKKADVLQLSKNSKYSVEEAARIARFTFFEETLKKTKYYSVALGHNANDQAETILSHLLRGSGIRGLSGMTFSREPFIRPLLTFMRTDIETYAHQNRLKYVIDSTNQYLIYERNKIRHQLIPILQKEFNPKTVSSLLRLGDIMKENELFLKYEANQSFNRCVKTLKKDKIILDINQFFSYFKIIQAYILFYIFDNFSIHTTEINYLKITDLLTLINFRKIGAKFPVSKDWEILIDHDGLVIHQPQMHDFSFNINFNKVYSIYNGEQNFIAELIKRDQLPSPLPKQKNIEYIDFKKVFEPLKIRNFQDGDFFIPLNFKGKKKISDFFTDNKIPLHLRKQIPILECATGIIWIIGYRIDDRFKITNQTKIMLKMEIREAKDDKTQ